MISFRPTCMRPENFTGEAIIVQAPDVRSTWEIAWSCISVIVLCTWSILHLNVPPDVQPTNFKQRMRVYVWQFLRKLIWMVVTVIAPEYFFYHSATRLVYARRCYNSREEGLTKEELSGTDDTEGQGRIEAGLCLCHRPVENPQDHCYYCCPAFNRPDSETKAQEPSQPSGISRLYRRLVSFAHRHTPKGKPAEHFRFYTLAKQAGVPWSLKHQLLVEMGGLAIRFPDNHTEAENPTEEEYHTMEKLRGRFQMTKLGETPWKPHCKHRQIVNGQIHAETHHLEEDITRLQGNIWVLDSEQLYLLLKEKIIEMPRIRENEIDARDKSNGLVKFLAVVQVAWLMIQLLVRKVNGLSSSQLEVLTLAHAVLAFATYAVLWSTPKDVTVPFYIDATASLDEEQFKKVQMWEGRAGARYFQRYAVSDMGGAGVPYAIFFCVVAASAYGAVHLIAWEFNFPTEHEKLLWHIMAGIITGLPYLLPIIDRYWSSAKDGPWVGGLVFIIAAIFYIAARVYLIVESFRSLGFLPPDAFTTTWAANAPHLG